MAATSKYQELEEKSAVNFRQQINTTLAKQVIYLGGIINEKELSKHLKSRQNVEEILKKGTFNLTALRAGIIVGSGSASFEIIRDLVEKLPVMITPKWLNTKCQPIGIADVISFLNNCLLNPATYNSNYDIGGPDILSYKNMLLGFAKARGLNRYIFTVPVMTPKLSSYWLYFVTSTSYKLATALVSSMKVEVICRNDDLNLLLNIKPKKYDESLNKALTSIGEKQVISSWKDSLASGRFKENISEYLEVPEYGCLLDQRKVRLNNVDKTIKKIWAIGGDNGWYYANILWKIRGFLDKLFGGVGLRRGRTDPFEIHPGDSLDFWRVLYANKEEKRLLLFAEMKVPGDAWLEFKIANNELIQTATFQPKGIFGRLYWYSVLPLHGFVFNGLINALNKHE